MPQDNQGKYQMNDQKVRHANRLSDPPPEGPGGNENSSVHSTTFDHGDGTGHTEMADGSRHEHPDMESHKDMLANMMADCGGQGEDGKPMPAKMAGGEDSWD